MMAGFLLDIEDVVPPGKFGVKNESKEFVREVGGEYHIKRS